MEMHLLIKTWALTTIDIQKGMNIVNTWSHTFRTGESRATNDLVPSIAAELSKPIQGVWQIQLSMFVKSNPFLP